MLLGKSKGFCFFFQAEDGIRDIGVTEVQTCALPILDLVAVREPLERGLQPALADVAPRTDDVGPDLDAHGAHQLHARPAHSGRCAPARARRSEEHTSELQSRQYLVCRLLLEKKNKNSANHITTPTLNMSHTI